MGVLKDTAQAGSKSRKPRVSRRILQDGDESLSDIFEESLSPEFRSKNRASKDSSGGQIRNVEKEAELVAPYLLGTKEASTPLRTAENGLNGSIEEIPSDEKTGEGAGSDGEAVGERMDLENGDVESGTDTAIGGSCEGSPVRINRTGTGKEVHARKEESGDEEMECGSVSSGDADVPKRDFAGVTGARRGVDASPDEGVVNSSDNEEVPPPGSKDHDKTESLNDRERKVGSNAHEMRDSERKDGSNAHDMRDSGDEPDVGTPSKKLWKVVSSQSESEGGGFFNKDDDNIKKCKEESKKIRLKVVVSPRSVKKYSPVKVEEKGVIDKSNTTEDEENMEKAETIRKEEQKEGAGKDKSVAKTSSEDEVVQKPRKKVQVKKEKSNSDARDKTKRSKSKKKAEKMAAQEASDQSADDSIAGDFLQDFKGIRCTSCNEQLNQFNRKSLCKHPTLGVLICRRCIEYYHEGDFTKDDCGSDEQCQWCGEGGNLICCDKCPSAFCKSCICRNLSRKEWTHISLNEDEEWSCYVCDKEPLKELIKNCKSVIKWAEKKKAKEAPRELESQERAARPVSKPVRDRSLEQLQLFLGGGGKQWTQLHDKLEESKKWAAKQQKKKLVQAILNIRSFRKYFKAYQDHFEHCLEEIMSSGELSGGEAATDSVTAPEDSGSKENSQESKERDDVGIRSREDSQESEQMDEDNSTQELNKTAKEVKDSVTALEDGGSKETPKKNNGDKSKRRVKTTPKRPSKDSISEDDVSVIELDGGDDSRMTVTSVTEIEGDDSQMAVDDPPVDQDVEGNAQLGRGGNQEQERPKKEHSEEMMEIGPAIGVNIVDDIGIVLDDDHLGNRNVEEGKDEIPPEKGKESDKIADVGDGKPPAKVSETEDSSKGDEMVTETEKKAEDAEIFGSEPDASEITTEDHFEEAGSDQDGDAEDESKSNDRGRKKKKRKLSKDKSPKESAEKSTMRKEGKKGGKKEGKNREDDFERLLMDEMGSDAEVDNRSENAQDSEENSDLEEATTMKRGSKAKKNLTKAYGRGTAERSKYTDDGSTSDTEVSLIDVDLADVLSRKSKKKKRKPMNIKTDSDTDAETDRMVQKSRKRKKKQSSEEDQDSSEKDGGKSVKKKSEKNKGDKKRRRKKSMSSSSDIDDEIERLDIVDLTSGDTVRRGKKSKKGSSKEDKKKETEKDSNGKETSKKKRKKKEDSELSSFDDDEELPEINYDTDPEMLLKKNEGKKSREVENAEEDLAEDRLREELEDEGNEKGVSGSSSEQSEGEGGKKSKGGGGGRGGKRKGKSGKKGKTSNDSEDEGDENGSQEEQGKSKKKGKVHRLLKSKLISSSSSSNSDQEWNPKKKKANDLLDKEEKSAEQKKRGKKKGGSKKKGKVSDSDFTDGRDASSDSDSSVGTKIKKKSGKRRSSRNASQDSSSDDAVIRKVKRRKRGKGTQSDSDKGSSDDFAAERRKKRSYQVDKKKSRIKKMASSNSEAEVDEEVVVGSGSELESPGKGKARKKIRKVMSKKKLTKETKDAAEEERERRKRVLKRRQELIATEMDSPQKSSVLQEVILDKDLKTKEVLLEVDKRLVKVLKPHQAKGIQFMFDCTFETLAEAEKPGGGCILAHCMGLGKTLQVIAYLYTVMNNEDAGVKTALVVAPLNTVFNWEAEFEKWQENLDDVIEVYELASYKDNQSRADILRYWQREGGVMIMGYTMYRNLCFSRFVKSRRQKETFHQTLVDPGPDVVICDEGHLLKNDATATAKAMNSIRTMRRICLTGTPLQNNLIEYHCMVQFVKPQLLGTRKEFSNRFVNPISNGQCADSSPYDVKIMKKRAHILHNLLSGSVQRKDYSALAPYLPPKYEYVVLIRLSAKQIELYEKYLETHTGSEKAEGRATSLFKDYQTLLNVWTHPRLLKLAAIRTEKMRDLAEVREFVNDITDIDTSDEEEMNENVKDSSSSGDELMKAIKANHDSMKEGAANGESKGGDKKKEKRSNDDSSDDNSDSSVEIVKTWNTRRTRKDGEEEEILEPLPPKKRWFTDLVNDEDDLKVEISGKLVLLFEILNLAAAVGEKILLFSQSLLTLDLIEDILEDQALKNVVDKAEKRSITLSTNQEIEIELETYDTWTKGIDYFRIDGSTDAAIRKAMCDKFNDTENVRGRLFIVSTKAGSLGINLVAANRVILFDACWNPSHDIQSIFRVYRFGQEKAVYIYRFIAQGTMEERIYDRQVTKQSLAQRVVDEHQVKRHYTFTELNELYNFQPDRLDDPNREERPTPILPKDFILAELLHCQKDWIVKYHEHNSLLENVIHEGLTEEERKAAWTEYEAEKEGRMQQQQQMVDQDGYPPGLNPGVFRAPPIPQLPPPSMAEQLQQMSRAHQPRFSMAAQSSALRQIIQQANQQNQQQKNPISISQLQNIVQQANQHNQKNPVSLNQLIAMSQMGQGPPMMPHPPPPLQRFMGPSGSNTVVRGALNNHLPPRPPPGGQSNAVFNNLTGQLIRQALSAPGMYRGQAPGPRVHTVPTNMPDSVIPPVQPSQQTPKGVNGKP